MRRLLAGLLALVFVLVSTAVSAQIRIDPNGRPNAYAPGEKHSLWVWYDGSLWRVRATTANQRHVFNGWVQFQRSLLGLGRDDLEGNVDIVFRFGDRVGFHLVAQGDVDGFNLRTAPGTPVTFYVEIDGRSGNKVLNQIFIGRRNQSPRSNPFTLYP